jgi:hypothetical protein
MDTPCLASFDDAAHGSVAKLKNRPLYDKHIATVDADGVALAAIQGLNQKMEKENAELKQELAELKQLVMKLADKKD